ncbi:MAG TPA: PIN domain-containing protein [Phenylobacterium sp.]|uniref:type II toxin-antitoxin system VapC family toxin n=1 Tax=Phenylobacterium sp. TaxID=1871053 RepID=UPI002C6F3D9A|nr:PIN domain-containing protein [Phenylobacterium sp.]HSV04415.1 PIN domain-containing protein [Phenylobacterium sp.]
MILADTSIWVDHFRTADLGFTRLLDGGEVLVHPFVIGELCLGNAPPWDPALAQLALLPATVMATDAEVMGLISAERLFGRGIGYVDAHLLAATRLTPEAKLWTRDGRLHRAAVDLGVAYAL